LTQAKSAVLLMFQQEGNWFHRQARLLELSFFVKKTSWMVKPGRRRE